MQRDARTYLFDVRQAADLIVQFNAGRSYDEYLADLMLRSAVERQFEIIGEALSQLSRHDALLVTGISEYQRIIAFRNVLIHAYAQIDDELIWQTIETKLPILRQEVNDLLGEP